MGYAQAFISNITDCIDRNVTQSEVFNIEIVFLPCFLNSSPISYFLPYESTEFKRIINWLNDLQMVLQMHMIYYTEWDGKMYEDVGT
jgi:hypothetical protein